MPRHFLTGSELTPEQLSGLLDRAAHGAFALHCLPAHPGEEISAEVLYGARQRIWDQAENRRHAQKGALGVAGRVVSLREVRACRSHASHQTGGSSIHWIS